MPKGAGETNLHVYFPIGGKRKRSSVCGASRWREVDMLDRWIQISPAAASDCRDKPEPHCSRAEHGWRVERISSHIRIRTCGVSVSMSVPVHVQPAG